MKYLFLIINLFLNVIRTIMYSYYRAFEEGEGGRSYSEGFFCFSFRVLFLIVFSCQPYVLSLTVAKIMTCSKDFKTKYFFFYKVYRVV